MKTFLAVIGLLALLAGIGAGALWYSGAYNIGADDPHWPLTLRILEGGRIRAVAAHTRDVAVPGDLADPQRVRRGAGNYDAMCTGCHLKPGVDDSELRKGLYPQPPHLARPDAPPAPPAEQFWIVKHGLKATAMPAWSRGGVDDGTIWDMVALLQVLPQMSPQDYKALVESSEGHTHAGAESEHDPRSHGPSGTDADGAQQAELPHDGHGHEHKH